MSVIKPLVLKVASGEEEGGDHAGHSVLVPMGFLSSGYSKLREAQKDHIEKMGEATFLIIKE